MRVNVLAQGSVPPVRDSRSQILSAASSCIAGLGLRATRVEDVLRAANVSRATFYRYFANMDAVIVELAVNAGREALAAAVAESDQCDFDGATRIARVIAAMAGRETEPAILTILQESDQLLPISNLIMETDYAMAILVEPIVPLLDAGRADGTLRPDLSNAEMVEWLTRNSTSIRHRLPPGGHSIVELEAYVNRFVMPGLLAAKPGAEMAPILARLEAIERRLDNGLPA